MFLIIKYFHSFNNHPMLLEDRTSNYICGQIIALIKIEKQPAHHDPTAFHRLYVFGKKRN